MRRKILAALAICGMIGVSSAYATTVDLVNSDSGTINGALFEWTAAQPTGTGVIQPFVRIQANGTEEGYNTSFTPTPLDAKSGKWTHNLLLSDVPVVNVGGTDYLQFLLDINQTNVEKTGGNLLTLNALQIYLGAAGNMHTTNISSLGTLIYDMGAGNSIELDYDRNPGSGAGDMYAYIPTSLITGSNPYLYLYSAFGNPNPSNDGFEEWATVGGPTPPVPEPGTMILLGAGFLGLAIYGKRRRNNA